jgi:hypothetical protein
LLQARKIELAIEQFNLAERLGACPDACGGGRWFCHMLFGNFEQAWQESDRIAQRGAPDPNRLWSGRSLDGKRVVVRCLHGLGDAIQFIRFVSELRQNVESLHVEVPACLIPLFKTIPAIDSLFSWELPGPVPVWDEHIEVMELPRYFRVGVDTIPATVPYLFPRAAGPSVLSRDREEAVVQPSSGLRIGLAWQSSTFNAQRRIPLADLQPLLSLESCRFVSLQPAAPEDNSEPGLVPDLLQGSGDILQTASLIQTLDLVITVDTMAAHLAGALGKPIWVLLTKCADWRWMMDRDTSPWYPTMRLFRQGGDATWPPVVARVCEALANYLPGSETHLRVS